MSNQIVYVTDDTFEDEVLNSDKPVLVDYWATWCKPCLEEIRNIRRYYDIYHDRGFDESIWPP